MSSAVKFSIQTHIQFYLFIEYFITTYEQTLSLAQISMHYSLLILYFVGQINCNIITNGLYLFSQILKVPLQIYKYLQIIILKRVMKQQIFEELESLIQNNQLPTDFRPNYITLAVNAIISHDAAKFRDFSKPFINQLAQKQYFHLHADQIIDNIDQINFMVCKHSKLYSFKNQHRAYCITGRVINVYKRKKNPNTQQLQHRNQFVSLVQQGVIRLHEDDKWVLHRNQKNFTLDDILLQHDMPENNVDQVCIGTQALSPFVPLQKVILMIIPSKIMKPECQNFIKSSLLHVYLDQSPLISKILTKQNFYKNSHLKGIYFIDEGEIQVKSGRILARGWTTSGKVKASGFGWKFKPVPFIRLLVKNPLVWKQFITDLKMNDQYPFNIIHILGLNDDQDFTDRAQWKSLGRKKLGNRSSKLPKIHNKTFDDGKFQQIQRLRHYDNRLNDVFVYKQDLLTRKLKGVVHGKFEPLYRDQKSELDLQKKRNMIIRMNSKRSQFSKKQTNIDSSANENILIMSVLKRLQSINDFGSAQKSKLSISYGSTPNQQLNKSRSKQKSKKQLSKITPMQIHNRLKNIKKNNRYL